MPGITLHYFKNQADHTEADREIRSLYSSSSFEILLRAGDKYPFQKIETPEFVAFIEGKIYSQKIDGDSFKQALENLWENQPGARNYFWQLDGEFVIFIASKSTDRVMVINDFLGRLPVYKHSGNPFIISRDLYSIQKILGGLDFDKSGVYQYLRLGFPLGQRTLYQNIEKIRYKSFFQIESKGVKKEFGDELNIHGSLRVKDDDLGELYAHFHTAVKSRSKDGPVALSLSGGMDSRAILGILEKEKLAYELFTFHYSNPIIDNDLQISKELASLYNRPLKKIQLEEWSPQNFQKLTKAKMGMNYLGMAFIFEFLKSLSTFDLMLTGDGGDKTLAPLHPLIAPGKKKLAQYILLENQISSRDDLERILNVDTRREEQRIIDYLSELPGKNTKEKYKSFLLFERGMNWLFEGEDRNREMIWSTSPFYSPKFFEASHRIREKDKANYILFSKFLERIDSELNGISNANWNFALSEKSKVRRLFLKQKIKQEVKTFYRKKPLDKDIEDPIYQFLVAELSGSNFKGKLPIKKIGQNNLTIELGWHLLTLAYLIKEIDDK